MKPGIVYHKKEQILSIRLQKNKAVDSDIQDNVVIDYDKEGNVVGFDVMGFSLQNFVPLKHRAALKIKQKN